MEQKGIIGPNPWYLIFYMLISALHTVPVELMEVVTDSKSL